jgi:hemolysin III
VRGNHLHDLTDAVSNAVTPLKPLLRGWLHAGTFPLAVAAGVVLIVAAPSAAARIAAVVFTIASSLLFGVSALYHRGHWRPPVAVVLRRMDHSNIFVMIAGTYTPFGVLLLAGADRVVLLTAVWGGALLGVLFRVFWMTAPRWLYTPIYLALGWVAVFWMPDFYRVAGAAVVILLAAGGLMYSGRGDRVRPQEAEPVTALVRVPRGVPRLHRGRVHRSLHRGQPDHLQRRPTSDLTTPHRSRRE